MCNDRRLIPVIDGRYRRVYAPAPDVYRGIDTSSFRYGETYTEWIANDFSLIRARDGLWHSIGITHPWPPRFIDSFNCGSCDIHEAENQLFHAVFKGTLRELYEGGCMTECDKLLYPQERPGQRPECWAPAVFCTDSGYGILYSPEHIYFAESDDLFKWNVTGSLFSGCPGLRDPFVFSEGGKYQIIYNDGEMLWRRETVDFRSVTEPRLLQSNGFAPGTLMESPSMIKFDGVYYLLWCVYDGQNGCYDNRTYVYASDSIDGFDGKAPLAMLRGHAPELIEGEDGQWYIASVFYPENGLSLAPIRWEKLWDH